MKVVTCISDRGHPGYRELLAASCRVRELELVTLVHEGPWLSHRLKDRHLREYLETLPEDDIVLFTDGYDTALFGTEDEIVAKFFAFKKPLVFTAEKNCWPEQRLKGSFPPSNTVFRYLNCGGYVGYAGVIRDFLGRYSDSLPSAEPYIDTTGVYSKADLPLERSNQYFWSLVYLHHQDLIALDRTAELFLELGAGDDALSNLRREERGLGRASPTYQDELRRIRRECSVQGGRLVYGPTGTRPVQVHLNGPVPKLAMHYGELSDLLPGLL